MNSTVELPRPTKSGKDAALAGAVERAREAAVEEGGEFVGAHLGFVLEDTRLGTHYFECTNPGYRGWYWGVTVTRIPRSRTATTPEAAPVPGPAAPRAGAPPLSRAPPPAPGAVMGGSGPPASPAGAPNDLRKRPRARARCAPRPGVGAVGRAARTRGRQSHRPPALPPR